MVIGLLIGGPEVKICYKCNSAERTGPHFRGKLRDLVKSVAAERCELAVSSSPGVTITLLVNLYE